MTDKLKSGQDAPASGLYGIVGPRGGHTGQQRTVVANEPMPPTPKAGQSYVLDTPARNAAGRGKN